MNEVLATVGVGIAGLLIHASWRLASVATKLDYLCERMVSHENRTDTDIRRLHDRVDAVEHKIIARPSK